MLPDSTVSMVCSLIVLFSALLLMCYWLSKDWWIKSFASSSSPPVLRIYMFFWNS